MGYADTPERGQLVKQVLGARTPAAITEATLALRQWVAHHPDDLGIVDGFEALATMRECAEVEEVAPTFPAVGAGRAA